MATSYDDYVEFLVRLAIFKASLVLLCFQVTNLLQIHLLFQEYIGADELRLVC
jgi:hypothetical protein